MKYDCRGKKLHYSAGQALLVRLVGQARGSRSLSSPLGAYAAVGVRLIWRAPSPRTSARMILIRSAELVAICNYEELDACRNKIGACLIAFTSAYMCLLSRTSAYAVALIRNLDHLGEPASRFP